MVHSGQLTPGISMELVSHMGFLANISGPLLLVMHRLVPIDAPASLGILLLEAKFPHLWGRTTFVSQA